MRLIFHGLLAERYGREHFIQTSVPVDAIEGLSRQLLDWPRDVVIDVPGYRTVDDLKTPTEAEEIHLVPAMYGGGGKFGSVLVGAALIGIGIATGGVTLPFGIGAISEGALIATGVSLALTGVSQLFMKAPTISKSNDPEASKYLGTTKGTTAVGTPITLAWGRIPLTPHWLSIQVDSTHLVTTSFPASTS